MPPITPHFNCLPLLRTACSGVTGERSGIACLVFSECGNLMLRVLQERDACCPYRCCFFCFCCGSSGVNDVLGCQACFNFR